MPVNFSVKFEEDKDDLTAPYNELEVFSSFWDALRWKHVRKRIPICLKKSLHNRYMLANVIYLGYTIALLVVDFDPDLNPTTPTDCNSTAPSLDDPLEMSEYANRMYIGLAIVNVLVAFLYLIAWRGRSWFDVVLIPEYLNHVQAGLYLWSSIWYPRQDTLGGYYTMAVHRIELTASSLEVFAAIGWMVSWYMTYTRALGRGFTLDDPDTMAYLTTTANTFVYVVYNIQMNVYPEQYGTSQLFTYGDILGFIGAIYYISGTLRDENWFWFLPLAGQYGIAAGRIHRNTGTLPIFGQSEIRMTDLCIRRKYTTDEDNEQRDNHVNINVITTHF